MINDISPKAEIDPRAKIGKNCKIFPFVYIEGDVEIGDNCIIFPFVSIMNGTRMGGRNKIHQGSVIGALPQDFNFRGEKSECIIGENNIIRENVVINRATHHGGKTVIGNAYRLIFHGQTSLFDSLNQVRDQVPDGEEVRKIIEFISATKKGLIGKK